MGTAESSEENASEDRWAALDAARETDPEGTLRAYLDAPPLLVARDAGRLGFILAQISGEPGARLPAEVRSLFEFAMSSARGDALRLARAALANDAYYAGDSLLAEDLWGEEVLGHEGERDETWLRACNNYAVALGRRGAWFESLVHLGEAYRTAVRLGRDRSAAFASARRGHTLVEFGAFDTARAALETAAEHAARLDDDARTTMEASIHAGWGRLHRRREEWPAALAAHHAEIACLEAMPDTPEPVLVTAHSLRIATEASLEPARLVDLIEEMRALPERFRDLGGWRTAHARDLLSLELDLLLADSSRREEARAAARECLARILETLSGSILTRRLQAHARRLRELDLLVEARRALEAAESETLRRLLEVHEAIGACPHLATMTDEDEAVLHAYRERILDEYSEQNQSLVETWRSGHPACKLIERDDVTRICAWCHKIEARTGRWIPVGEFLPHRDAIDVTHTICDRCRPKYFPEDVGAASEEDREAGSAEVAS